jgi:hypothetical protein
MNNASPSLPLHPHTIVFANSRDPSYLGCKVRIRSYILIDKVARTTGARMEQCPRCECTRSRAWLCGIRSDHVRFFVFFPFPLFPFPLLPFLPTRFASCTIPSIPSLLNPSAPSIVDRANQENPSCIVNTGSKQGITTPPGNAVYNVSKSAVKTLTEQCEYFAYRRRHCCRH